MKKRGILCCFLPLCLLLTACGTTERQAAVPSPLGQAAGMDESEPLLVIDDREIPAWQYLYWLAVDCQRLESRYAESGVPLDWSAPAGDGTLETAVKAAALEDTVLCAVVASWSDSYGRALTEAEEAALPAREVPFLSEAQSRWLTALGQQYAALYQLYETPDSPLAPEAEALARFEETDGFLKAQRLLIPKNGDRESAYQQITALFARINSAQDANAAFADALAETGGDVMADTDWTDSLREAASALEPGQLSGILETEAAFVILRRLPTDQAALRQAHFESLLQSAGADASVRAAEAYSRLSPSEFWSRLRDG